MEGAGGGEDITPSTALNFIRVYFPVFPGGMESGRTCLFLKADEAFLHPEMAKGDHDKETLCLLFKICSSSKEPHHGFHLKHAGQKQLRDQELWHFLMLFFKLQQTCWSCFGCLEHLLFFVFFFLKPLKDK